MKKTANLIIFCNLFLILIANYLVFMYVPNEKIMGAVQRIFYFHVGSATAAYAAIAVLMFSSIAYLAQPNKKTDAIAEAAGEVSFLFCSIVMLSGMIWGHAAWNTWFRWEPRLISFLLLWCLCAGYNLLRFFADASRVQVQAAVLGVISAFCVPLMIYSVKLLPQTAQIHPQIIEKDGLAPEMKATLLFCIFALTVLCLSLIYFRSKIGIIERKLYVSR